MIYVKEKKEVLEELLNGALNSRTEYLIKEDYYWQRHLEYTDDNSKEKAAIKMESAKCKRYREENVEPFIKYLEKELKTQSTD